MHHLTFLNHVSKTSLACLFVVGACQVSIAETTQIPTALEPLATDASLLLADTSLKQATKNDGVTFDDSYRIKPNFRISYQSYGQSGIAAIQGLVPLAQTVGKNITFLEAGYNLNMEGDNGINALIGYRGVSAAQDHLWGGYVGFYNRPLAKG